jgi:hypothetical protein
LWQCPFCLQVKLLWLIFQICLQCH